jgi:hypothetical protein
VPLPHAEGGDWNTLVFYLGGPVPLGTKETISFTQLLTDEMGEALPIIAVAVRYEGMEEVTISTALPSDWKAFRVDVVQDGFGTKKANRSALSRTMDGEYVRCERNPKPGYGRAIEWEGG